MAFIERGGLCKRTAYGARDRMGREEDRSPGLLQWMLKQFPTQGSVGLITAARVYLEGPAGQRAWTLTGTCMASPTMVWAL